MEVCNAPFTLGVLVIDIPTAKTIAMGRVTAVGPKKPRGSANA